MPQWEDRPLVGRAAELDRLTEHVERARSGRPSAVLVAGDAGVGKSRLLAAVGEVARERGLRVLTGHCIDLGDVGLPYLPFVDLLRPLGADPAAHPAVAPLLGAPDAPLAEGGRLPLFEGVAALLGELAAAQPVLLVVEDLHWADRSSRELLRYLLTRLVAEPVLVVASYRSDDLHRRHPLRPVLAELVRLPGVERLDLAPLPDADLADLVRAAAAPDGGAPERLVADVVARAEGNAFYAEELLAAGSRGGELPWALSEVLLSRVEELGPAAQQVLRVAAVVGRRVRHDLLAAVAGLPEVDLDAALAEAVHRHVLVVDPDGRLRFRHALLREAVLADLLPGERTRVHAAVAGRLRADGTGTAAELAHHARESNDLPAAFEAALRAADEANAVGAPAEALQQLEGALTLWPAVPDRHAEVPDGEVGLLLRAAAAARAAGELHRGVALLRSAGDLHPADPLLAGRVQYTLAQALIRVDDLAGAVRASTAALELVPEQPLTPDRVWATATRARTAWSVGGEDEVARAAAGEALAGAEQLGLDGAWSDTMISLARMTEEGDPAVRTASLTQARERARRAGDVDVEMRATFNLATIAWEAGDLAGAAAYLKPAVLRGAELGIGWSFYVAELRYLRVLVGLAGGEWDAVQATVDGLGRMPDTAAHVRAAALHVAVHRGADVRDQVEQAWATGDRLGHAALVLTASSAGIELAGWRGDATAAVAAAERGVRRLREIWPVDFLVAVRLVAVALGPVADAAAGARAGGDEETAHRWVAAGERLLVQAREAQELFAEHVGEGGTEVRAWALRLAAEHARLRGTGDPAAWAAAGAEFGPAQVWEQARCRWREAEALLVTGDRGRAADRVRAAHAVAVSLGAQPLRARLEALARRGRLDVGLAGRPAPDAAAVFTPREAEVLGLVAKGLTNRQVGAELYISEKTVSVHLSRVLAKLGVSGRTEAVAVAAERGLLP
ncbi:helix-turn-helix transcriptional regulator [Klenkia marina]|uniref:helix-turn-helix transcriptional regulator n=1 Tax=Klenkia marina TaxID=1960309 RepID=UPI000B80CD83|nr:AAA family ATPase [Klenkia marina]